MTAELSALAPPAHYVERTGVRLNAKLFRCVRRFNVRFYLPVIETDDEKIVALVRVAALTQHASAVTAGAARETPGGIHKLCKLHFHDCLCGGELRRDNPCLKYTHMRVKELHFVPSSLGCEGRASQKKTSIHI